ncbi:MAG: type II toxin-antitoxin system HipA family toxin [Prevotellaceae bacterium]|nr:type II toxin-antitoxin system HipA family toxin [Candidatus Faecinaster equi]
MNTTAEIFLWGTRVGIIHQDLDKPYASFEYDEKFSNSSIEISPIMMPLSNVVYEFPALSGEPFFGMPGLVVDSLPDTFGNKVIEQWLASQGKSITDFTAIDRLCYMGKRGMGALEYVPASSEISDINESINVSEMVKFASDVLNKRDAITLKAEEALTYSQFVQVGSSAGGARAKALIAWNEKTNEIKSGQLSLNKDFDYWLMKFDKVSKNGDHGLEDVPEYTLIEYAYYKMALDAGVQMNECRIYSNAGENHFITKRFDRVEGKKIHMQSLGALAHISYKEPRLCSYEMAAAYMREMKLPMVDIEQFYSRMVFNCIAVNQDDHVKNISFLMDRNGRWRLSPAYDITYSYDITNKWLSAHQMTVNGKKSDIKLNDLLEAGEKMGLKKKKCMDIISKISLVVADFEKYAREAGIREKTYMSIKEILNQNKIEI